MPLRTYMCLGRLLTSEYVYAANINDIEGLKVEIDRIAKVDRLPRKNTLQGLLTIRECWDHVDLFAATSKSNKWQTKWLETLSLLATAALVVVSCIATQTAYMSKEDLGNAAIALSLTLTFVTSLNASRNPGQKWIELRGAALALESEIWMFRTRTEKYSLTLRSSKSSLVDENQRIPVEVLAQYLKRLKQDVLKSASVQETSFYSGLDLFQHGDRGDHHRHGQYKHVDDGQPNWCCAWLGCCQRSRRHSGYRGLRRPKKADTDTDMDAGDNRDEPSADWDNQFSPIVPSDYIAFRVKPTIAFYQVGAEALNTLHTPYSRICISYALICCFVLSRVYLHIIGATQSAPHLSSSPP
jgi:hypothetical protein